MWYLTFHHKFQIWQSSRCSIITQDAPEQSYCMIPESEIPQDWLQVGRWFLAKWIGILGRKLLIQGFQTNMFKHIWICFKLFECYVPGKLLGSWKLQAVLSSFLILRSIAMENLQFNIGYPFMFTVNC